MLINNFLLRSFKGLSIALILLNTVGCVSFERLIKVPVQAELTSVKNYNTELYNQSIHIFNPIALDNRVVELQLEPRVKNLFFLIDQSAELSGEFRGIEMSHYAREILHRFVQTMPNKEYTGALFEFDPSSKTGNQKLQIVQYTVDDAKQALNKTNPVNKIAGNSLASAIDNLSQSVGLVEGSSAIVLITSWAQINKSVAQAVMRLRQRSRFEDGMNHIDSGYDSIPWQGSQEGICLYTVGVGNRLSRTRLETVDSCGFSVAASKVSQPRDMVHFVQTVLYKGPADTDGDGIYDFRDRCPKTTVGRTVDYTGCLRFTSIKGSN